MIQYLFMGNEQTHPLHETDKNIIDSLITKKTPDNDRNGYKPNPR